MPNVSLIDGHIDGSDKNLTDSKKIAKWQKEKLGDKNYNEIQEKAKHDNEIIKTLEDCISFSERMGSSYSTVNIEKLKNILDLINHQKEELEKLRAYIHDNGLEWDLLSYCKKNETSKKNKCEYCIDEICVNADCPMRADYCPVYNTPDVCRYEKRGE